MEGYNFVKTFKNKGYDIYYLYEIKRIDLLLEAIFTQEELHKN